MDKIIATTNTSKSQNRYPVTQELIDDVINNELRGYTFPVKPVYNSRIRANGITKGEIYRWGQLKNIVSIEIGKQDKPDRKFLIDTLLHEYFEADIMKKQYSDGFYRKLSRAGEEKRHEWIYAQIADFFKEREGQQ